MKMCSAHALARGVVTTPDLELLELKVRPLLARVVVERVRIDPLVHACLQPLTERRTIVPLAEQVQVVEIVDDEARLRLAIEVFEVETQRRIVASHKESTLLLHGCRRRTLEQMTMATVTATAAAERDAASQLVDVHALVAYGELDSLRGAVQQLGRQERLALLNRPDSYGLTLLHEASRSGQVHVVEWLLEQGVSVTTRDANAQTALHMACAAGNIQVASRLIENVRRIGVSSSSSNDPSSAHVTHTSTSTSSSPSSLTAWLNAQDSRGRTAMHWASAHDHDALVRLLVTCGADATLCDAQGKTAIAWIGSFPSTTSSSLGSATM